MSVPCYVQQRLPVLIRSFVPRVQHLFGHHGYYVQVWAHIFSLQTFENIALEDLLPQFKIPVYVTSSHRSSSLYSKDLRKACVWILGNEGQGVSDYALQHAEAVTIPQPGGQESLNVAIAGSICFFEMVRQRI